MINIKKLVNFAQSKRNRSNIKIHKVVAIAISDGAPIAYATNQIGSGLCSKYSYHAEELLVKKLYYYARIDTVVVIRITNSGNLGISKPCNRCMELLNRNFKHIYFWNGSAFEWA